MSMFEKLLDSISHMRHRPPARSAHPAQPTPEELGLKALRQVYHQYTQIQSAHLKEKQLYKMLPLFCKNCAGFASDELVTKFPEAFDFGENLALLFVRHVTQLAQRGSAMAGVSLLKYFEEKADEEENETGLMILKAIQILSNGPESLVNAMMSSSLSSILVRCVHLFLDLPPPPSSSGSSFGHAYQPHPFLSSSPSATPPPSYSSLSQTAPGGGGAAGTDTGAAQTCQSPPPPYSTSLPSHPSPLTTSTIASTPPTPQPSQLPLPPPTPTSSSSTTHTDSQQQHQQNQPSSAVVYGWRKQASSGAIGTQGRGDGGATRGSSFLASTRDREDSTSEPSNQQRLSLRDLLVSILLALFRHKSAVDDLLHYGDLSLLFGAISSPCAPYNKIWRKASTEVLLSIFRLCLGENVISFVHRKGCVGFCVRNLKTSMAKQPLMDMVDVFATIFHCLKDSCDISQVRTHASNNYEYIHVRTYT